MASIDGLASGLDTTTIIQQLMQIERQPQLRIQADRRENDTAIEALKGVNTKFLAVKTAAEALTSATGWMPAKASSNDEAVAVATAGEGARPTNLSFTVTQLAAAGSSVSSGSVASLTDVVASGATIDVTKGADTRTIDVGDGSLAAVVQAINDEQMGVTATAVQVSPGEYRLQLSSTTTGADTTVGIGNGAFSAGTLGAMEELVVARDATLEVGGDVNSYTVTRPSNTMSDLLEGVTITLQSEGPATVSVESDTEAMTASVKKFVDSVNAALADIDAKTAYDTTTNQGAILSGDGMLRGLESRVLRAFSAGTTIDGVTYGAGEFGVSIERDGTIAFDEEKFAEAYREDPALVTGVLGGDTGLAGRLETVATTATDASLGTTDVGLITSAIESRERQRSRMDDSIQAWDNRLALREQALVRQFTALEVALSRAQSQGQWLASQLAGLPANTNSSGGL